MAEERLAVWLRVWQAYDGLLDRLALACKVITGVALVVLTVIFGWLVYGRYVLNDTPTWVEQASLLLVMLITFLGASVGIHENSHLGVSYFRDVAPAKVRLAFTVITDLMLGAYGLVMAWYAYKLTVFKWGSDIPLIHVPEGLRSLPISVCGVLMFLFSAGHLLRLALGRDHRAPVTE